VSKSLEAQKVQAVLPILLPSEVKTTQITHIMTTITVSLANELSKTKMVALFPLVVKVLLLLSGELEGDGLK
jgi:hypothetical protein